MTGAIKSKKLKTMIDLDKNECIKSIAVKGNTTIEFKSRFINGKMLMLMFSKVLIRSFVYDLIDVFCFPNEEIKEIYHRRPIIKSV